MPLLKSLEVRNFQALKHIKMDLSPGLNVVRGDTDVGKSSLVRSLKCLFYQGEGARFVRDGAKVASVAAETDNGHSITWRKGERKNEYEVDGNKIGRVGKTVPELVQDTLQVRVVKFGADTERCLNIQGQGEHGFLVNDPGAECARIIGGVSGASVLSDAVRRCSADVTQLSRMHASHTAVLEATERGLSEYLTVAAEAESVENQVSAMELLQQRATTLDGMEGVLEEGQDVVEQRSGALAKHAQALKTVKAIADIDELVDRSRFYQETSMVAEEWGEVAHDLKQLQARVEATTKNVFAMEELPVLLARVTVLKERDLAADECVELASDLKPLRTNAAKMATRCERFALVDQVGMDVLSHMEREPMAVEWQTTVQQALQAEDEVDSLRACFNRAAEAWKVFKRDNPLCPTCGQQLPEKVTL